MDQSAQRSSSSRIGNPIVHINSNSRASTAPSHSSSSGANSNKPANPDDSSQRQPRRHRHRDTAKHTIQSAVQLQSPFSFDNYNPIKRRAARSTPIDRSNGDEDDPSNNRPRSPSALKAGHGRDSRESKESGGHSRGHVFSQHHGQDQPRHHLHGTAHVHKAAHSAQTAIGGASDRLQRQLTQPSTLPSEATDPATTGYPTTTAAELVQAQAQAQQKAELAALRHKRPQRTSDLQTSLANLSASAHTLTRDLDATHYALLEKTSLLQTSLSHLQTLADTVATSRSDFRSDAQDLVNKTQSQIQDLNGFSEQEEGVKILVARLAEGKKRARDAEVRLDKCRLRLEGWERLERERTRVRKRRVGIMWVVVGVMAVVVFVFVAWKGLHHPARRSGFVRGITTRQSGRAGAGVGERLVRGNDRGGGRDEQWKRVLDEL